LYYEIHELQVPQFVLAALAPSSVSDEEKEKKFYTDCFVIVGIDGQESTVQYCIQKQNIRIK